MAGITTHVLDTARGKPAAKVPVTLELRQGDGWSLVGHGITDDDGRFRELTKDHPVTKGTYRITFELEKYFAAHGVSDFFYPQARIEFLVADPTQHFHVPLLLSPFGYSTYRGS